MKLFVPLIALLICLSLSSSAHEIDNEVRDDGAFLKTVCIQECIKIVLESNYMNISCPSQCDFIPELMAEHGRQINRILRDLSLACDMNVQLGYQWAMDDVLLWARESNINDDHAMQLFYYQRLLRWFLLLEIMPLHEESELPSMINEYYEEISRDEDEPTVNDRPLNCIIARRLPGAEDIFLSYDITTETKRRPIFLEKQPSQSIFYLPATNKTYAHPMGTYAFPQRSEFTTFDSVESYSWNDFASKKAASYGLPYQSGMFVFSANGIREIYATNTLDDDILTLKVSAMNILYNLNMDNYQTLPLDPNFLGDINSLPGEYSTDVDRALYRSFFTRYGTHFFLSAAMGGKLEILVTLPSNIDSDTANVEEVMALLRKMMTGTFNTHDLRAYFDEETLNAATIRIIGGPLALPATPLAFVYEKDLMFFKNMFYKYPGMVSFELQEITSIIQWLRPELTFLSQAMTDYLNKKSDDITKDEILIQANEYSVAYCPQYFVYEKAIDTGSGYHHGIFPPSDTTRRFCDCCIAVEGANNQGNAECTLYCKRVPSAVKQNDFLTPRSTVQPSVIFKNVCYNEYLFNETKGSKYQFGCLNPHVTSNYTCTNLSYTNLYKNTIAIEPGRRNIFSEARTTWTVVGIVLAVALLLAILFIVGVAVWVKYRASGPVSAYRSIPTTITESERLVEH